MFEDLGIKCSRGSKATSRHPIGELRDGTVVALPVRVVRGTGDGPTLCLTGTIHGDEPNGLASINRICDQLNPTQLAGTVVAFPLANPFAFITKGRISSLDYERLNLNRVFPGNAEGLISQRLAATIFEQGIRHANYHIDYHEGGYDFIAKYLLIHEREGDSDLNEQHLRLAKAFGLGIPINISRLTAHSLTLGFGGTASWQANQLGIPSLCNELGGAGRVWPEHVETAVTGTLNVMKDLGMLTGEKVEVATPQLIGTDSKWPRPTRGGWWEQVVELGQVVAEGEKVGHVRNAFGEIIEELHAPHRAVIFDIRNTAAIMTGEWTVNCGKLVG